MKILARLTLLTCVCAFAAVGPQAQAVTYSFTRVTANNVANSTAGEAQLSVDVTSAGANQVLFQFRNNGLLAMSICDVYFDDGTLLGIASIINGPGVAFSQGAKPGNLPGGNNIDFGTTAGFLADSDSPVQPNGVNPGETVGILFNLIGGQTFNDTINALNMSLASPGVDVYGGLRIGIHVQGFANGGSESFVNGPPRTNVPDGGATVALLGLTLSALGVAFHRSRK